MLSVLIFSSITCLTMVILLVIGLLLGKALLMATFCIVGMITVSAIVGYGLGIVWWFCFRSPIA